MRLNKIAIFNRGCLKRYGLDLDTLKSIMWETNQIWCKFEHHVVLLAWPINPFCSLLENLERENNSQAHKMHMFFYHSSWNPFQIVWKLGPPCFICNMLTRICDLLKEISFEELHRFSIGFDAKCIKFIICDTYKFNCNFLPTSNRLEYCKLIWGQKIKRKTTCRIKF